MGERQAVLFRLENNIFGVPISNVQEIIKTPAITAIPNTPEFFKGVVNLRGKVIPVLGLSEKLGLRESDSEERRTIIVNVGINTAGIIVDAVCDVLKIAEDSIETEVNLCDTASRAISGIAKLDDRLVILLNLDQLLASDDVFSFEEIYKAIEEYYRLNS
ncbi:MAG: chemotaxis protein CheW [Thermacetogeniaceae bacterium]